MSARTGRVGGVATIAALRLIDITSVLANEVVTVVSSAVTDQLGAEFYWSTTSTGVDDGVNIIQPASAPATGRWLRVNAGMISWTVAGGAANAITATYPTGAITLYDGLMLGFRATTANTTATPTFSPNSLTARTITARGGQVLFPADIPGANAECLIQYRAANTTWELLNPAASLFGTPGGRLTLTTGTPYMTASVTNGATVFYTPATTGLVPLWNGGSFTMASFSEVSQALSDTTKSPAAATSGNNYDVFVWSDSGTIRATRGPAWSSATARGTGAGTTQITQTNGLYTNTAAITNGPAAGFGTYVGSFAVTAGNVVRMVFGGTGGTGGESCSLNVWNAYSQTLMVANNVDNTASWTYGTVAPRLKNNSSANETSFIVGLTGFYIHAFNTATAKCITAVNSIAVPIALDSTTTPSPVSHSGQSGIFVINTVNTTTVSQLSQYAPLGFHFVAPLEYVTSASGTLTFFGNTGSADGLGALFTLEMLG